LKNEAIPVMATGFHVLNHQVCGVCEWWFVWIDPGKEDLKAILQLNSLIP
jgi:hypothetical protein